MSSSSLVDHAAEDVTQGQRYFRSQQPLLPSFYLTDKHALIALPEDLLKAWSTEWALLRSRRA
ncbi:MAG: hypothetical protein AAF961_02055 [Planctomycetota bacterium]